MNISQVKRFLLGAPLNTQLMHEEKIPKWKGLAVLSSDALSSVAYATEEILIPLAAFSAVAVSYTVPIALCIVLLLLIVAMSYRQTIQTYQNGGGAYVVSKENLGVHFGLIAGAALMIDYVLTVAVSAAAGVMAISSAFPALLEHRVGLGTLLIILLTLMNLRGIRESATIFAFPTYFFIASIALMLGIGAWKAMIGEQAATHPPVFHEAYPAIPVFLLLRAFSSGCAALTGIEAISNGVPAFKAPAHVNAKTTMTWMVGLLMALFFGVTALSHVYGISPLHGETAVSQLARAIAGQGWLYYSVQLSTAMILILACNTSYNGFPWLAAIIARDRFLPRQFAVLGDRLVFSNSIIGLSLAAIFLLIAFNGDTHALVPLYSVGVFLGFTLSQSGMVRYHLREKKTGWRRRLALNLIGAITTFAVMIVVCVSKFTQGAWIVIVVIALLLLVFRKIHSHYLEVGRLLTLANEAPKPIERFKNTVIVPISGVHRGVIQALRYATSISDDVRACYVEINPEDSKRVMAEFQRWAPNVPFVVLKSPFRSVIRPILDYIDDVDACMNHEMITVLIPEFVTAKWWQGLLHNQTAFIIRAALAFKQRKVVTSVRYHLKGKQS